MNYIYLTDTSSYQHPFNITKIFKVYKTILATRVFLVALALNGILYSAEILFGVMGPYLVQNTMHYSAIQFGHIALILGLSWFSGGIINRLLINIPLNLKTSVCFWSMFFIAAGFLIIDLFVPINIYLVIIPTILYLVLGGVVFPNNFARAVSMFPDMSGSANALFGGFTFLITGIASAFGALLKSSSIIPLAVAYLLIIILCLLLHYLEGYKGA